MKTQTSMYVGTKIVTAWPEEKDGASGYAVKYEDGYTSWSPKQVFEQSYVNLGNIQHLLPFQQRVIAECAQLESNMSKLSAALSNDKLGLSEDDKALLETQFMTMASYRDVLGLRIARFNSRNWRSSSVPTHKCIKCGALWSYQLKRDTGAANDTWNLVSEQCGECCDNVPMAEQIVALTSYDLENYVTRNLHYEDVLRMLNGPAAPVVKAFLEKVVTE